MGIESCNSAKVLLLLRIVFVVFLQRCYLRPRIDLDGNSEDTINVGAGLIALSFNSGDDSSMETLDSPVISL